MRIAAKGPGTDNDMLRIGINIRHRGKVQIKAIPVQICSDDLPHVIGLMGVAGSADGLCSIKFLHLEACRIGNAGNAAAFLIGADHQRQVTRLLQAGEEGFQLFRLGDVLSKENNPPGGVFRQLGRHLLGQGLHAVVPGAVYLLRSQCGVQRFWPDNKQLPNFFLQRHGRQQLFRFLHCRFIVWARVIGYRCWRWGWFWGGVISTGRLAPGTAQYQ